MPAYFQMLEDVLLTGIITHIVLKGEYTRVFGHNRYADSLHGVT